MTSPMIWPTDWTALISFSVCAKSFSRSLSENRTGKAKVKYISRNAKGHRDDTDNS